MLLYEMNVCKEKSRGIPLRALRAQIPLSPNISFCFFSCFHVSFRLGQRLSKKELENCLFISLQFFHYILTDRRQTKYLQNRCSYVLRICPELYLNPRMRKLRFYIFTFLRQLPDQQNNGQHKCRKNAHIREECVKIIRTLFELGAEKIAVSPKPDTQTDRWTKITI